MDLLAMLEELDDDGRAVVLAAAEEDLGRLALVCAAAEATTGAAPAAPEDGARWLLARAREALGAGRA